MWKNNLDLRHKFKKKTQHWVQYKVEICHYYYYLKETISVFLCLRNFSYHILPWGHFSCLSPCVHFRKITQVLEIQYLLIQLCSLQNTQKIAVQSGKLYTIYLEQRPIFPSPEPPEARLLQRLRGLDPCLFGYGTKWNLFFMFQQFLEAACSKFGLKHLLKSPVNEREKEPRWPCKRKKLSSSLKQDRPSF